MHVLKLPVLSINLRLENQLMNSQELKEKDARESTGWFTLAFMMVLFPVLFFLCVWAPMWFSDTTPY